jgi:hypothetical protein
MYTTTPSHCEEGCHGEIRADMKKKHLPRTIRIINFSVAAMGSVSRTEPLPSQT